MVVENIKKILFANIKLPTIIYVLDPDKFHFNIKHTIENSMLTLEENTLINDTSIKFKVRVFIYFLCFCHSFHSQCNVPYVEGFYLMFWTAHRQKLFSPQNYATS